MQMPNVQADGQVDVIGRWPSAVRQLVLLGPPTLVLVLGLLIVDGNRRARAGSGEEERTYTALLELRDLRTLLLDVETGSRGYLVTGNDGFLANYVGAGEKVTSSIHRLLSLTGSEEQSDRVASMTPVIISRLQHAERIVGLRRSGVLSAEQSAAEVGFGKLLMDSVQSRIEGLEDLLQAELAVLKVHRSQRAKVATFLVVIGTLLSFGLTLLLNGLHARYSRRLEAGTAELVATNMVLEEQAVELEIQAAELEEHMAALEEASTALQSHHAYLSAVLDANSNVICVKDAAGCIQLANRATADLLGLPADDVVGRLDTELNLSEDDVDLFHEEDRIVLATDQSYWIDEQPIQIPTTGEIRWFEKLKAPLSPPDGGATQILVVAHDITARLQVETALQRSKAIIERTQHEIMVRLAQAAEFRDDETGRHTRRVGQLAAEIARMLGLPEDDVEMILRVAPLHDVGKIGIPDSILLKRGKLTPEEFEIMKRHTIIGGKLLGGGSSELMTLAEQVAVSHHERWDGRGYPHAIGDGDIPLPARVVSVADVVDALSHDRPYRRAWPMEQVTAELVTQRGEMFDPAIADACLEIITTVDGRDRWLGA